MNSLESIYTTLKETIIQLFPLVSADKMSKIELHLDTDPSKQQFGDLSSNCALIIGKDQQLPPASVAQTIKDALKNPAIERVDIAAYNFINIVITQETYKELGASLYREKGQFFVNSQEKKKSYSIEFVSANPTGPLHIGHGRGGIIGDVLARVIRFLGNTVTTEFYINDAGSQMQKLGSSLIMRCKQLLNIPVELPEDAYHGEYLIQLAQECIDKYGTEVLENPPSFFVNYAEQHLLRLIQKTLTDYGISFDVWFSEKTLHESGAIEEALTQLKHTGFLYTKDDALWFTSTVFGDDKDRVVKKNSGELTYVAADIAYAKNKMERGFDQLIMILGQDHHSYVVRLKAVMQALGYNPQALDVILYQLVTLKESGQSLRLSKRAGRSISLDDVITTVGRDVARFFYLHKKADAHLDFDLELALKHTEENPVYYIQYAYVRTKSILQKAEGESMFAAISEEDSAFLGEAERSVLKKIISLKTLLKTINSSYQTHMLAYYTIELAQHFHAYYSHHRVIDIEQREQSRGRLLMTTLLRDTFKLCFDLLGISAPERM
ncbi:arginine--tRNA ligase [Candidatus Dependentiae bacterium]|nr:arginine--tRNA ligase [Candidatus Dependentiae bacterium]